MQKINLKDCVKTYFKNSWWKIVVVLLVVAVDLISKALIVPQDETAWVEVPVIADWIVISPTRNKGAGFSSFYGQTTLLIVLTVVFLLGISIFDVLSKQKSKLYVVSSGLIIAGAIGNFVDRILFGYVRDFIYFKIINFPVFNVADISLTIGVILMFVYIIFFSSKKDEKINKQKVLVEQNGNLDDEKFNNIKDILNPYLSQDQSNMLNELINMVNNDK